MRILGLDPGLRNTGWGVIDVAGNRLRHIANGVVRPAVDVDMANRLLLLHQGVSEILETWRPDAAAVEETFVNKNPESTLKLGLARGVVLLAPAELGLPVAEYAPNRVKKSVVGAGHADKDQVQVMVRKILGAVTFEAADSADALAVAICHAHYAQTAQVTGAPAPTIRRIAGQTGGSGLEKAIAAALAKEAGG